MSEQVNVEFHGIKGFVKKIIYKSVAWLIVPILDNQQKIEIQQKQMNDWQTKQLNNAQREQFCRMQELQECVMHKLQEINNTQGEQFCKMQELQECVMQELQEMSEYDKKQLYKELDILRAELEPQNRCFRDIHRSLIRLENAEKLEEKILEIKAAGNHASNSQFAELTNYYENEASKEIRTIKKEKMIVILCTGLKKLGMLEAIRKEAYKLLSTLERSSKYNVRLISVETDHPDIVTEGNIIYLAKENLEGIIQSFAPNLIIIEESTALFEGMWECFAKYKTLYRTSAQNPLQGISKTVLEELSHLEDMGTAFFMVQSNYAAQVLMKNGFHQPVLSYPLIDKKFYNQKKIVGRKQHTKFTIGFASSPMSSLHDRDRGMELLEALVQKNLDFVFEILWRDKNVEISKSILEAKNCNIHYGKYDMEQFYENIDCLLIPYLTENCNHACSHSALEAALCAIPVVATDISGVSEIVKQAHCGIVCKAETSALSESLLEIAENYDQYSNIYYADLVYGMLDERNLVSNIEKIADLKTPNAITLKEWDKQLREHGKYLVKGTENIKRYYEQMEVADVYTKERFLQFPWNCFDELERASIRIILNQKYAQSCPEILDIASGDGRIVQECLKFGRCTATDNSEAMLSLVKQRFANDDNLKILCADYFNQDVDGKFDVITTFRYIRHFEYGLRRKLYKKIADNLKPGGILIFDIPNRELEVSVRKTQGWYNYNIYDVFSNPENMTDELRENGFEAEYFIPVGKGLIGDKKEISEMPITWTVGAVLRSIPR